MRPQAKAASRGAAGKPAGSIIIAEKAQVKKVLEEPNFRKAIVGNSIFSDAIVGESILGEGVFGKLFLETALFNELSQARPGLSKDGPGRRFFGAARAGKEEALARARGAQTPEGMSARNLSRSACCQSPMGLRRPRKNLSVAGSSSKLRPPMRWRFS